MSVRLPALIEKALIDAGYDLFDDAGDGWTRAHISGHLPGEVWARAADSGALLAVGEPGAIERIGLPAVSTQPPPGACNVGCAESGEFLYQALQLLHAIQAHPSTRLARELEARLEKVPATERTQEVRRRIGQDLFREALIEFWGGRCALSGAALPPELLRASHAKPWKIATEPERLDPFNGLLLAVRFDALFDKGLIAFDDHGRLLMSPSLDTATRHFVGLNENMRLRLVLPGHLPYLRHHRQQAASADARWG